MILTDVMFVKDRRVPAVGTHSCKQAELVKGDRSQSSGYLWMLVLMGRGTGEPSRY